MVKWKIHSLWSPAQVCLIYGLIDPKTRLIRYIGQSTRGSARPKEHLTKATGYCRRWVESLKRKRRVYEIVVLEPVQNPIDLNEAEKWWIAFGRACGWPLTNCTDGGSFDWAFVQACQRRRAEREAERAAAQEIKKRRRLQQREAWTKAHAPFAYSSEELLAFEHARLARYGIPVELERQCFSLFDADKARWQDSALIDAVLAKLHITRETVAALYAKWLSLRPQWPLTAERCVALYKCGLQSWDAVEAFQISPEAAAAHYNDWVRTSLARGKQALEADRKALYERLKKGG